MLSTNINLVLFFTYNLLLNFVSLQTPYSKKSSGSHPKQYRRAAAISTWRAFEIKLWLIMLIICGIQLAFRFLPEPKPLRHTERNGSKATSAAAGH